MAKFEIDKATNGEYFFRFKATGNDEIVLRSEQYTAKKGCENGIESVKTNAPLDARYDKRTSANDKYYFNLKAGNGEVIGTSRLYENTSKRDEGISLVKDQVPTATTDDLTKS
jgi:uncharacterized protein YegP (UPF0339 family)